MMILVCVGTRRPPDSREDAALLPEGVQTFVTGLGALGGDGQQVGRATTLHA